MGSHFRDYLPEASRYDGLTELDARGWADTMRDDPVAGPAVAAWLDLFETATFTGITSDGSPVPDLFPLGTNENAPTTVATKAAEALLDAVSPSQRAELLHPLDSKVWRAWMNPEFYVNRFGLRLEEQTDETVDLVLNLLRESLSPAGYAKARTAMHLNGFLGQIVNLPKVLNERSYNVNIFGTPSENEPWGWSLYGHHLCLNSLFIGNQQILAPVFFGAEPNHIDSGPHCGTYLFSNLESAGLNIINSLPSELAQRAVLYNLKRDPLMPAGRIHPGDELHLGGAFQDNRVIPYEGAPVSDFPLSVQEDTVDLINQFLDYQPDGPRTARLEAVREHLDETWFSWIGGRSVGDAFYYRIHSPVILLEFDHHAGVFLTNTEPEPFHIHTIVRFPNANDYGVDLVRRHTGSAHLLDGPA